MSKKIESVDDLNALRKKVTGEKETESEGKDIEITVHMSTCGIAAGAREVFSALMDSIESVSAKNVTLRQAGCRGLCDREPMATLTTKAGRKFVYGKLDSKKARKIVMEHVLDGNPVNEYLVSQESDEAAQDISHTK